MDNTRDVTGSHFYDPCPSQQTRYPYLICDPYPAHKMAVSILVHGTKALLELFCLQPNTIGRSGHTISSTRTCGRIWMSPQARDYCKEFNFNAVKQ